MRRHLLAIPLAATLVLTGAAIAEACYPGQPWYQTCGWFGTQVCVCHCNSQGEPWGCRLLEGE